MSKEEILRLVKEADPANPVDYVVDIVREFARDKLDKYIFECHDCSCADKALPKSITKGNANATIMVIAECVNKEQVANSQDMLVNPLDNTQGGAILQKVFDYYGVNQDEVFYMNAVNCFPYKEENNKILPRTPSKKEVNNCKAFLDYAINLVRPTLIILLGSIAMNVFYGAAISKQRGQWINVYGIPAMPTYHPQYFIEVQGKKSDDLIQELKDEFCDDIYRALLHLQEHFPDNNALKKTI